MSNRRALEDELAFALRLADAADAVAMRHFRSRSLVVDRKPDRSEVTVADKGAEQAMRDLLSTERPDHGVLGEEHGTTQGSGSARWILDPIDGTSNYVRGVPVWAALIALEVDDVVQVGVVSAPAMGMRWWAARGLGAFADGRPIHVSRIASLDEAFLSYSEHAAWSERGLRSHIDGLRADVDRQRAFGDFWQHMLVAEGAIDVAAEAIVNLWDLAAVQVIVEEAGGRFTDLQGRATPSGGSALSTNGLLHDAALAALTARG